MIKARDTRSWFDLSKVTFNDIWNRQKRIFVTYSTHNFKLS